MILKFKNTVLGQVHKFARDDRFLAMDMYAKFLQKISDMPIIWDTQTQKLTYCKYFKYWKFSAVHSTFAVFFCYTFLVIHSIVVDSEISPIHISVLTLMAFTASMVNNVITIGVRWRPIMIILSFGTFIHSDHVLICHLQ